MAGDVLRISYTRLRFAAELLADCRRALLKAADDLERERMIAETAIRSPGRKCIVPDDADIAELMAGALYAQWIGDALRWTIAYYAELDGRLVPSGQDEPQLPAEPLPEAAPKWPIPPVPARLKGDSKRLRDVCEDINDASRAISTSSWAWKWEITEALENLRSWADRRQT